MSTYVGKSCPFGHTLRYLRDHRCAECQRAANRAWKLANPDTYRAAVQNWKRKNRIAVNAKNREWRLANPDKVRACRTKSNRRANNMPEPTRPMPAVCECCGGRNRSGRMLSLDHCHTTGTFRGWLCDRCNTGIGKLGDNLAGLQRAVSYLERAI